MTQEPGEYVQPPEPDDCKHYCSFGCGNTYEFVVVTASDSTTQFLCVPCFVSVAMDLVAAITMPDDPDVKAAVAAYAADEVAPVGKRGKKRGLIGGIDTTQDGGVFSEFEPDVIEL